MKNDSIQRGILYMVCGTAVVPIMDAIAKYLGASMSPLQITWGRFFFQCAIMALVLTLSGNWQQPKLPVTHVFRGCLLATATVFFFWSLRYLPLADAIAIFFVQPMILTLISALFLGEKIGWHRRIAVLTGFAGALLIIRPGSDTFSLASLLPLAAAFFFSTYLAVTRARSSHDSAVLMQFVSGLGAALVLSALLGLAHLGSHSWAPRIPVAIEWGALASIGVIAAAGHLLVVMAMKVAPASLLAPFGYVEIIAASALGWVFFNDWPDPLTWIGILIITGSGIYVFARETRGAGQPPS